MRIEAQKKGERGMLKKNILIICLALLSGCALVSVSGNRQSVCDSDTLFLTSRPVEQTYAYELYVDQPKDYMSQIRYLVNLTRRSELHFLRNNRIYLGEHAAEFLEFKIYKFSNEMQSVEDFIEKVGSYSRTTNKPYYIVLENGELCPFRNLLYNELRRLQLYEKTLGTDTDTQVAVDEAKQEESTDTIVPVFEQTAQTGESVQSITAGTVANTNG